jgi:hypothetical protein
MVRSEEVRLQHDNHIDYCFGAVFARWRWLGIFSLAWLARSQHEPAAMLLDPNFAA